MRDLDTAGAERQRKVDHLTDAIDTGAMHDRVHGEWQLEPHNLGRQRLLAREGAIIAGDMIGGWRLAVLDRNLRVVEPCLGERAQGLARDAHTAEVMRLV